MSSDKHCCVSGCKNSGGMHAVLHGFPNPDKDRLRFNTWLYSVGSDILGLENAHIYKFRRVCRRHFEDKYLCRNNRVSNIAVPTLYLPESSTRIASTGSEDLLSNSPSVQLSVLAPGTSRATGSTIDIKQTPTTSGETKTITKALPTLKLLPVKSIIEDKVQDTTATTQELPSCSTTVENTGICDDNDDAVDDSDTLVESNLKEDVEKYRYWITMKVRPKLKSRLPQSLVRIPLSTDHNVENTDICDDNDDADDDSDPLVESSVCRVCLAMDVKMYDLNDIELREMFQNITGIAVTENNHPILERLCWECAGRLKAAAAFRNKALLSDALLQGLASTGEQIRKNDITLIKDSEDYLKTAATLTIVKVFHTVDINPENDGIPPLSENNDTKIVRNKVRKGFLKQKNESIIAEDNVQTDVEDESMVEAPINTEMEYDQFDHICPNTGEQSGNVVLEKNPLFSDNIPLKENTINSANSSPPPSCSHVKPKYPILGYLLKTPGDCEDKVKKHVIKITRDSILKIVPKNSKELISAKSKNINVKIGGISKKTSNLKLLKNIKAKANTPTDEEWLEEF